MAIGKELSITQQNMLQLFSDAEKFRAPTPSVRELQEALDISSTSVVSYNLRTLSSQGLISKEPRIARSLRITAEGKSAITPDPK